MNFLTKKRRNSQNNKPQSNSYSSLVNSKKNLDINSRKFRMLNELLYTTSSEDAYDYFKENYEDFKVYHDGFATQTKKWPVNPNNLLIKEFKKQRYENKLIIDLGCGEANIAKELEAFSDRKILSYDLQALNNRVTICDIKNLPLENESADVAIFCLSLMGTNLIDFIKEANRVLKCNGLLFVAEIESRIANESFFLKAFKNTGYKQIKKKSIEGYFVIYVFRKNNSASSHKLSGSNQILTPCLYKKR